MKSALTFYKSWSVPLIAHVSLDENLDATQCEQIGDDLVELINAKWKAKLADDYGLDCLLEIEFETHFSRFLMPTIRGSEAGSKKRYAGLIINSKTKEETTVFKGLNKWDQSQLS